MPSPSTLLLIACILLGLLLWYFIGLYYYTRGVLSALCNRRDSVRLKLLEGAMDSRFFAILLAPPQLLLDLIGDRDLDALHPERDVRRAREEAEWARKIGDEGPGYTSPLLEHGRPAPETPASRRAAAHRELDAILDETDPV